MNDRTIIMPRELTDENGSRHALSGEFKIPITTCGCDDDDDGEYSEQIHFEVISWVDIKEMYRDIVTLVNAGKIREDESTETLAQLVTRRRGELGVTSKDLASFRYSTRTYIKLVEEGTIVINRMQINHLSDIAKAIETPLHIVCEAALRSG